MEVILNSSTRVSLALLGGALAIALWVWWPAYLQPLGVWVLGPYVMLLLLANGAKTDEREAGRVLAATVLTIVPLTLILLNVTFFDSIGGGLYMLALAGLAWVSVAVVAFDLSVKAAIAFAVLFVPLTTLAGLFGAGPYPHLLIPRAQARQSKTAAANAAAQKVLEDARGLDDGHMWRAIDAWNSAPHAQFRNAAGATFTKAAAWHMFGGISYSFDRDNRRCEVTRTLEGPLVAPDMPNQGRRYSGDVSFDLHRQVDGRWILTNVRLVDADMTSEVHIDVSELAAPVAHRGRSVTLSTDQISRERALAALKEWLSREVVVGQCCVKDPGGTVEIAPGQPYAEDMSLLFSRVPYHRAGASTKRGEYTGKGIAEFRSCEDGQVVLGAVYMPGGEHPGYDWHGSCGRDAIPLPSTASK